MDGFYLGGPWALSALWGSADANNYFFSLPEDVQRGINERADEIHSAEDLHQMADYLTKKA